MTLVPIATAGCEYLSAGFAHDLSAWVFDLS